MQRTVIDFPAVTKPDESAGGYRSWPKIGISLPPESKKLLRTLAQVMDVAEWRVVEQALVKLRDSMPKGAAAQVSAVVAKSKPGPAAASIWTECPPELAGAMKEFLRFWLSPSNDLERKTRALLASVLKLPLPDKDS
jgi:hypothetical protein